MARGPQIEHPWIKISGSAPEHCPGKVDFPSGEMPCNKELCGFSQNPEVSLNLALYESFGEDGGLIRGSSLSAVIFQTSLVE